MTIIELVDPQKLSNRTEALVKLEIDFLEEKCRISPDSFKLDTIMQSIERMKANPLKPDSYFIPSSVTQYQLLALKGAKWTDPASKKWPTAKEKFKNDLGLILSVLGTPTFCFAAIQAGSYVIALVFGLLGCLMMLALGGDYARSAFHNRRIARVDVDSIVKYKLDHLINSGIRWRLDTDQWERLLEVLRSGDSELSAVFTKFCEGQTEYVKLVGEANRLMQADESEKNCKRVELIEQEADRFRNHIATEIKSIFKRRDDEARQAEKIAQENAERARKEAERLKSIEAIQRSMDHEFKGKTLDTQLEFMKANY